MCQKAKDTSIFLLQKKKQNILQFLFFVPCLSLHVLYVVLNTKPVQVFDWFPEGWTGFSIKGLIKGHLTFERCGIRFLNPEVCRRLAQKGQNIILQREHTNSSAPFLIWFTKPHTHTQKKQYCQITLRPNYPKLWINSFGMKRACWTERAEWYQGGEEKTQQKNKKIRRA